MNIPTKSLNVVFTDKEKAELRTDPLAAPKPEEVLVRATWTLISTGTETICYGRRFEPGTSWDNWVKYPFYSGYSFVGVVEVVGSAVKSLKVGDRVSSTHEHRQYVVAHESAFTLIPEGVSPRDATWQTLCYIVQNGVRRAQHELGDSVAIIGLGPLGQLANQYVHLLGPKELIAIDPDEGRLKMAKAHGATQVLALPVDQAMEEVTRLTGGRMLDVVYDITGNDRVFAGAQQLLRRFGKLALIGDTGTPSGQHLTHAVINRSLNIIGSHATHTPAEETDWAHWTRKNMISLFFQYLCNGRMKVSDLNTHSFSPRDVQAAYQQLLHHRGGTMGCQFDWSTMS